MSSSWLFEPITSNRTGTESWPDNCFSNVLSALLEGTSIFLYFNPLESNAFSAFLQYGHPSNLNKTNLFSITIFYKLTGFIIFSISFNSALANFSTVGYFLNKLFAIRIVTSSLVLADIIVEIKIFQC